MLSSGWDWICILSELNEPIVIGLLCYFFNDTATTEIYTYWHTLSLHDALPISALTLGNIHQAARGEDTHVGAELVRFTRSNMPLANLWYTKAATDHLV